MMKLLSGKHRRTFRVTGWDERDKMSAGSILPPREVQACYRKPHISAALKPRGNSRYTDSEDGKEGYPTGEHRRGSKAILESDKR
jgi:hypothetical protein